MISNSTPRAAAEYGRLRFGPVTEAISTMRAADPDREAVATLRTKLLRQLADDLTALDRLDAIAVRLALR